MTDLTALTAGTPAADSLVYIVLDPAGTPLPRKAALSAILDFIEANGAAPASFLSSGTLADARVAETNVTQHEAALSILASQLSDLSTISQAEAEGGTNTTARLWTAERVAQAIAALAPDNVTSGAGAPGSTPGSVGLIYVDTTADVVYVSTDTASSADWEAILTDTSGATLSAKSDFVDADDFLIFDSAASDAPKLLPGTEVARRTLDVNAQTGTTYTLVLADAGKKVTMSNASANTLTIPTNASVAFPTGTIIGVSMLGAGTTTVDGATGVTVNGVSGGGAAISAQYTGVTLTKLGTDTWLMEGNHGTVA